MPGILSVFSLTFNVATMPPPVEPTEVTAIQTMLQLDKEHDILAIGFQEVRSRMDRYLLDTLVTGDDEWTSAISDFLHPRGFILLRSIRVLGTILSVFVKVRHLLHVRDMETQYIRLSAMGYLGLKAGVCLRMKLYGIKLCLVNSHLSAHDNNFDVRVGEYNNIIENVVFKNNETPNILYHDYIIWMGDLNFRLEENTYSFEEIVRSCRQNDFEALLEKDQLVLATQREVAFHELQEEMPNFPPTYKFRVGTDDYDEKRRPAWTDRVMFRYNKNNYEDFNLHIEQTEYASVPEVRLSDHKPVVATFRLVHFARGDEALLKKMSTNLIDFDPVIHFKTPTDWKVDHDGPIEYEVERGKGALLSPWDWIGLFKAGFRSLTQYVGYTLASDCRLTNVVKKAIMMSEALSSTGDFVLIYFSAGDSVLGMTDVFQVTQPSFVELAQEAFESSG